AHGKVFPAAHNSANWCFPSLDTIITGRFPPQGGCSAPECAPPGARRSDDMVGVTVPTIAQLIEASGPGYCTYPVGKGTGIGFDASKISHNMGRPPCARCNQRTWSSIGPTECQFDPAVCPDPNNLNDPNCSTAPRCGEDIANLLGGKDKVPSTG